MFVCLSGWKVLQSEITLNVAVVPHKPFEVATFPVSFSLYCGLDNLLLKTSPI